MIDRVVALEHEGKLSEPTYQKFIDWFCTKPTRQAWKETLRWWFLVLGFVLVVSGVIYFGAYNWASLHRFSKFAILELLLGGLSLGALLRGLDSKEGQVLMVSAATTVGALLAVFGQVYQTGADSFLLFLGWSALIGLWCFLGRSNVLWCLQFVLLNVSFVLWFGQRVQDQSIEQFSLYFFLFNLTLSASWALAQKKLTWMATYPTEALIFASLTPLTLTASFRVIFEDDVALSMPVLALAVGALVLFRRTHLATMATVSASLLCLGTAVLTRLFSDFDLFGVLLIGIGVLFELALLVKGLTYVHRLQGKAVTSRNSQPIPREETEAKSCDEISKSKGLFDQLDLSEGELALLSSQPDEMPWYVQAVVGMGAWVASLFVVSFFLIFITESEVLLPVYGLALFLGTLHLKRKKTYPVFFRHALLSVHIAGVMVTAGGIAELFDGRGFVEALPGLTALVLLSLSIKSFQDPLGQFLFGAGYFASGGWASIALLDDLGGTLWLVAAAAALAYLALNQKAVLTSPLKTSWPAVQRGFTAAFLTWSLFPIFESYSATSELLITAGLTLTVLWTAWKLDHPPLVLGGLLIFSLLTQSVPTILAAVLMYTLGFCNHQKIIQGLALLTLAGAGSFFYYSLEMTLMTKSITLMASGLTFLALRLLLRPSPSREASSYAL